MTTGTLTLSDFLLARIAEDEAVAVDVMWDRTRVRSANGSRHWDTSPTGLAVMDGLSPAVARGARPAMAHVARFDPARVLAECEAKRRIVAEVGGWKHAVCDDGWYTCAAATEEREGEECLDAGRRGGPCDCGRDYRANRILTPLALPYADHPDYREEWRP